MVENFPARDENEAQLPEVIIQCICWRELNVVHAFFLSMCVYHISCMEYMYLHMYNAFLDHSLNSRDIKYGAIVSLFSFSRRS